MGFESGLAPLREDDSVLGIGFPRHGVPESGRREEKCTVEQLGEHECIDEGFALCGYRLLYDEDWFRPERHKGLGSFFRQNSRLWNPE